MEVTKTVDANGSIDIVMPQPQSIGVSYREVLWIAKQRGTQKKKNLKTSETKEKEEEKNVMVQQLHLRK